jgi:hypothetical protein
MVYTVNLSKVGNSLGLSTLSLGVFGRVLFEIIEEVSSLQYKEGESFPSDSKEAWKRPHSKEEIEQYLKNIRSKIGETFFITVYEEKTQEQILAAKNIAELGRISYFAKVKLINVF